MGWGWGDMAVASMCILSDSFSLEPICPKLVENTIRGRMALKRGHRISVVMTGTTAFFQVTLKRSGGGLAQLTLNTPA